MAFFRRRAALSLCASVLFVAIACGDSGSDDPDVAPGRGGSAGAAGGPAGGSATTKGGADSGGSGASEPTAGAAAAGGDPAQAGAGGDDATGGDAGTSGSAAAGGDGGMGGSVAAGGNGGAGGSAELGGAAGAFSAAGAGGTGDPGGAGAAACNDDSTREVGGVLDDADFHDSAHSGGMFSRSTPYDYFEIGTRLGNDGMLFAWGPERVFVIGDFGAGQGHLFTASEGPNPGTHYCAADVLLTRVDTFRHTISMADWTELGQCPSPGDGTLSGCFEQTSGGAAVACVDDQARLVGDLDGDELDESFLTNAARTAGSMPATNFLTFGKGGVLALYTVAGQGSGWLILPEESAQPGLVVCVGSATLTPGTLSDRFTFVLDDLAVIGTCPAAPQLAVTGQIDGCL